MSGFVLLSGARDPAVLAAMAGTLDHRGDVISQSSIGQTRLAVLNRTNGSHFEAAAGRAHGLLVFIEGWIEDEQHLMAKRGSGSVVEALADRIRSHGIRSLADLRGAFVAGVVDEETGRISIFRCAQGQRPVYYWSEDGVFAAATEVKAILRNPDCPRRLDPAVLAHLLVTGVEPFDASLAAAVKKIPAGHVVEYDPRGTTTVRPLSLPEFPVRALGVEQGTDLLDRLLRQGLETRLGPHSSIGLFLSGGIDSYLIGRAVTGEFGDRVVTGTGGVVGDPRDETVAAADRAARLGLPNVSVPWPQGRGDTTLLELLERTVATTEQPGRYENALLVTHLLDHWPDRPSVMLSGDMADVLFGDVYYRALERAELLQRWFGPRLRSGLATALRRVPHRSAAALAALLEMREHDFRLYFGSVFPHQGIERLLGFDPIPPIQSTFDRLVEEASHLTTSQRYCYVHLRSSGQGSIDKLERLVARAGGDLVHPFLMDEVYQLGFEVPPKLKYRAGKTKILPRSLAARSLPSDIAWGRRMGFSAPKDEWLLRDDSLREAVEELRRPTARIRAHVDGVVLDRMVQNSGTPEGKINAGNLWVLLSAELWCQRFGI